MAGSWAGEIVSKEGFYAGSARIVSELSNTFIADSSAATVPDWTFDFDTAFLFDVGVIFSTPPPDTVTVTVKDSRGLTVATVSDVTTSGRGSLPTPRVLIGGGTVSISGNTTNSAVATVVLCVMQNIR